MDLGEIPIMAALKSRMRWLTTKQAVIGQNIANADTPGYRPNRLKDQDFSDLVRAAGNTDVKAPSSPAMKTTSARHISVGSGSSLPINSARTDKEVFETSPNENSVVLEDQLIELAETQIEYSMITNLYRKNMQMMKTALGRSG